MASLEVPYARTIYTGLYTDRHLEFQKAIVATLVSLKEGRTTFSYNKLAAAIRDKVEKISHETGWNCIAGQQISASIDFSDENILLFAIDDLMDLHTLAALMRPTAIPGVPMSSIFSPFLSGLSHLDQTMLPIAQLPEPSKSITPSNIGCSAFTPKKPRAESSSPTSSESGTVSSTQQFSPMGSPRRKVPQPIPEEKKDIAYFERRRKNNDAAKRSRDARRQKEEVTARRAQNLEQENAQLRGQLALMKSEMANIQLLLLSARASQMTSQMTSLPIQNIQSTPLQITVTEEKMMTSSIKEEEQEESDDCSNSENIQV